MDRHQPQDADAHAGQARQLLFRRPQRAFARELAGVDLVEGGVAGPAGVLEFDLGRGGWRIHGIRRRQAWRQDEAGRRQERGQQSRFDHRSIA
jgi:hypothetical protein